MSNSLRQVMRLVMALVVGAAVMLMADSAWAAPGDGPAEFLLGEFVSAWVNFAIYLSIIIVFGGAAIQRYFRNRRDKLTSGIEEAAELRRRAEAELAEYRSKLEGFESEKVRVLEEFRAIGERERDRLVAEAEAEAERIRRDAEAAIEVEIRQARVRLEAQLVDRALSMARERVEARMTPEERRRLADAGVRDVAEAAGDSRIVH
ncbi:MAG: hypothetical protein EA398_10070 [Deltaproteobacteria bacterium]|nr:MAG: hypothetical protein EA398_10070 [Deltaproteobacteria bacterium]